MHKKFTMILVIVLLLIAVSGISIYMYFGKSIEPLQNINTAEIKEIYFSDPATNYIVSDDADIELIIKQLCKMKLHRRMNKDVDGFAFLIDIVYKNDETTTISLEGSDMIKIDGDCYLSDHNYCDEIKELFDRLKQ